jgi:cysteine desulfurase
LKTGIKNIIPNSQFPFTNTSPYILCFVVPKISSDILLRHLEQKNVYLSSTSACSSKVKGFNPTLAALGLEEMFHKNVLRLSISKHTSNEEIAEFLSNLETVWSDLKYLIK